MSLWPTGPRLVSHVRLHWLLHKQFIRNRRTKSSRRWFQWLSSSLGSCPYPTTNRFLKWFVSTCIFYAYLHVARAFWNTTHITVTHNRRDGASNHQPHDCLLNRLFRRRSKKSSKLRVTGLCAGNSPVTSECPCTDGQLRGKCFHLMTSSWITILWIYRRTTCHAIVHTTTTM